MIIPVIIAPDKRLQRASQAVVEITEDTEQLLDDLYETMIAHDGIGISACQVGVMQQVCVIQIDEEDEVIEMINPRLLKGSGVNLDLEACLSLPYVYGTVERFDQVLVEYFDRQGNLMELEADDYLARCVQHELDHLAGHLFTEKIIEQIALENVDQWMEEHTHD
ncbi:peptide deformylase [Enterococcus timonensis]|uniref:peptide deformylase n=1 Tax=Enterococcus timonensis TaxID=1852364 RepID=UPI0008D98BF0|nr:peptide deformylase [Enterococcus timonensis]